MRCSIRINVYRLPYFQGAAEDAKLNATIARFAECRATNRRNAPICLSFETNCGILAGNREPPCTLARVNAGIRNDVTCLKFVRRFITRRHDLLRQFYFTWETYFLSKRTRHQGMKKHYVLFDKTNAQKRKRREKNNAINIVVSRWFYKLIIRSY